VDKRQQILDVSVATMARVGPGRLALAEVARQLGVSKTALYHYFPNKAALIRALLERETGRFLLSMERAVERAPDGPQKLAAMLRARFKYLADWQAANRLSLQDLVDVEALTRATRVALWESEVALVEQVLQQGVREGSLDAPDVRMAACALTAAARGMDEWLLFLGAPRRSAPMRRATVEAVIRQLMHGVAARGGAPAPARPGR
jgi:AcrR family transcriptional regulator